MDVGSAMERFVEFSAIELRFQFFSCLVTEFISKNRIGDSGTQKETLFEELLQLETDNLRNGFRAQCYNGGNDFHQCLENLLS